VSAVTANGSIVTAGCLTFPYQGAWVLDLVVANPDGIVGACEVVINQGLTLKGTAVRGGAFRETTRIRVAPGADGLRKPARAVHYASTKRGSVLKDLLRAAGETLASSADQSALGAQLPFYTQLALPIGISVSALFAGSGAVWRMMPDGTLWVGKDGWKDSSLVEPDDYVDIAEDSNLAAIDLGVDARFPLPGQALEGRKVSSTEVTIKDGSTRARVLLAV
jgi:hypothetical protein